MPSAPASGHAALMQLYYYPSNANLAPHILLEEAGIPYELVLVDRERAAQKDEAYLRLNPSGRIPTLVDGDLVLFEAAAICVYLADTHPEAQLAPAPATPARATFDQWLIFLTNTIQPDLMAYHYPEKYTTTEADIGGVRAAAEARLADGFRVLEAAPTLGPYLLGPDYSACDAYLIMLAHWARNLGEPPSGMARLRDTLDRIAARPAVARAFEAEGLASDASADRD